MTLTSDRATKGLYEKYISMIKRVTTKTMGGFSPAPKVVEHIANMKQKMVIQTNVGQSLSHKFVSSLLVEANG